MIMMQSILEKKVGAGILFDEYYYYFSTCMG